MYNCPIGVMVDCFRLSIPDGVRKSAEIGAQGFQMYAVSGEMTPENLDAGKRREFAAFVRDNGLRISALCGDFGAPGFTDREQNPARVERSKRILDLAKELGTTTDKIIAKIDELHEFNPMMGFRGCRLAVRYP